MENSSQLDLKKDLLMDWKKKNCLNTAWGWGGGGVSLNKGAENLKQSKRPVNSPETALSGLERNGGHP